MLIDGKEISKLAYKDIVNEIKIITKKIKRPPTLNIILIGENPSSLTYVNNKLKKCEEIGIKGNLIKNSFITSTMGRSFKLKLEKSI